MEKETNEFKMELPAGFHNNYTIRLLEDKDRIFNNGNTMRFCEIIENKWVIINRNTDRIENKYNPHLKNELEEKNCSNWRLDGVVYCTREKKNFCCDKTTEYVVDFNSGTITRLLARNEKVCKNCRAITDKSKIIGHYCEKCLTETGGLAHRYSYHSYHDGYKVMEKIDTTKNVVMGCEIERDFLGGWNSDFESEMKEALLSAVKILHEKEFKKKKKIERKNVFMRDGSLCNDGIEWITFPQTYKAYKENKPIINNVLEVFKKYNFGNSDSVGNHIHINRDFFGGFQQSKYSACKMAVLFSRFWNELKAIAKRDDTNYTEKPPHEESDDLFTLVEKSNDCRNGHSIAVNTQHNNTIEIRLWAGIDNADDLLLFLDITRSLAMFVKKKSIETCQRVKFYELFKYLKDKNEHIPMIIDRLQEKGITIHTENLNNLKGENLCV